MLWLWIGFVAFILLLLALDLGVFHRRAHAISIKEALGWSGVWIAIGLAFSLVIHFGYEYHWFGLGSTIDVVDGRVNDGRSAAFKYLTGYVIEKSLSVDNLFVIAVIFSFFAVPAAYQHRVLFWGILGALLMRGAMIALGAALIHAASWVLYLFGAFLILTAVRLLFLSDAPANPACNPLVRLARRLLPVTDDYHGTHLIVRAGSQASHEPAELKGRPALDASVDATRPGRLMLTPLALTLITVETTDLVFAVDSIPAIFAVTADPFLVFTSNIFAVLGLRSLYFALAGMIEKFRYLKVSLAVILALVGAKMLAGESLQRAAGPYIQLYLLGTIALILAGGIVASLLIVPKHEAAPEPEPIAK